SQRAIRKFASALVALPRSVIKLPKTVLQYLIRAAKFVYRTWIADSKAALNERGKGKRHFWKRYGRRRRKDKKEDHVAIEIDEEDRQSSEEDKADGPDNIIKRVFNIIKFTWMLFLTTGNVPSRESIHVYYQKQMKLNGSRESGLDRISEEDSCSNRDRRRRVDHSLDSFASRDSMSRSSSLTYIIVGAYTEATMLFSRQSTLDDLDDLPQNIPKTSERARPKLHKMYSLDMSNSSVDSGSSVMSRC
ncbi:hypothetical protein cypCar_00047847, partial [Cyprinus carpio]